MIRTDKLIITVCPSGSFMTRQHNPSMPTQPDEIADEVYRAWNEGASIAHIHARDQEGRGTTNPEVFREIDRRIREKGCDIILQHSTSPGRESDASIEDGFRALEPGPEMISIDIGVSVISSIESQPRLWTRSFTERLARAARDQGVKPEIELFTSGAFVEVDYLVARGLLSKPVWLSFALDMQRTVQHVTPYSPKTLLYYVDMLPDGAMFSTMAVGAAETPAVTLSILLGGHARVGFEDNVMYGKGVPAESNAQLVARVARIGRDLGRTVATPRETRELLGIPTR